MRIINRLKSLKTWRRLGSDRRGVALVAIAFIAPVLLAFGALAVASSYLYYRNIQLTETVSAAALAGASKLTTYYTSGTGSTAAVVAAAQTIATANEPTTSYGTILPAANVVVGNWNQDSSSFTSLASSGGSTPNAVQVTGLNTLANGNAVPVLFGGVLGMSNINMTKTAIASFGTGENFDTIILNDLSQSFSSMITQQRAADAAILNCIKTTSASTSVYGVTAFTGHATIVAPLAQASTNLTALTTKINALTNCGSSGMPVCSGSNIAAGLYSAIQQFSTVSATNTVKNVIIITDGVPNASRGVTYGLLDGVSTSLTSLVPICTSNCTSANLLTMAQNQANNASAAGINISTIYYSGSAGVSQQSSDAASLASLRRGTGVSLVAPTSAQITSVFGGFCATMKSAVVAMH